MSATRKVGMVTAGAGAGSVAGTAAAQVIVWLLAQLGIDAGAIEGPLSILLGLAGTIYGGYLVPGGGNGRRVAIDGE